MNVILSTGLIVDQPTANLNIYPRKVLEGAITKFNEKAKERTIRGGILNRQHIQKIDEPTHIVKSMFINESDAVCVNIEILENKQGQELKNNIKNGKSIIGRPLLSIPDTIAEGKDTLKVINFTVDEITDILSVLIEYDEK
jgi:hypothetical protein